jgi:MFS family permease
MNRIAVGLLVGGVLGILDGLTAWFTPEARPQMVGIVIGSTVKGLVAGAIIGLFARKVQSLGWTLVFGTLVGAFLAFLVAYMGGKYYLEIVLPGSLVGLLTGYATVRYGRATPSEAMR